jgi:regulator of sigma E protease
VSVLLWLIIINIAVFVHELAHYWAAKMQGVEVRAFSIGMGPIFWRRTWRGTEWRLSALPIGGYVDIDGMAPTQTPDGKLIPPTTGMARLPYWGKVWVLVAGPLSNILLAVLIVAAVIAVQGKPDPTPSTNAQLYRVLPGSNAESAGFKTGDVITSINGKAVTSYEQVRTSLQQNGERRFSIQRNGQPLDITFNWTPQHPPGSERPKFGVSIGPESRYLPVNPIEAISIASSTLIGGVPATIGAFVQGVIKTFTFAEAPELAGPVGMTSQVGQAAEQGWATLFFLAGLINFSLGIFNLLPIPGLDGGRIVLNTITVVRRRPFAPGQEEFINFLGFAFVLVFIGLVTLRDIARLGG